MSSPLVNDSVPPVPSAPSGASLLATAGRQSLLGLRMLLAMTVLVGVLYPAVVFGVGRLMPDRADGSMVVGGSGRVVGSALIGQLFKGNQWFQGRPSAADYDGLASGGSNLGAGNADLAADIGQRRADIAAANGVSPEQVPADAVTASASGLDPHISPAYALLQVNRVATARGLPATEVRALVEQHIDGRILGFLGEQRVNVLELNLALQKLKT
jgi:K+-transporting ATPase ATPase C chain